MPSSTIEWMAEAMLADRQILRAKLYVPRGRPGAVARSRLYERLDEGVRRDLTVVSAPAGFGKTTLLADWSRQSGLPVAWVSLDERDDDPIRFLSYLLAAIGTIHDGFGESTRAFLGSLPSSEELEPVLTALSNEILELPHDFVLVLDDYHVLRSGAVHDALAFLLEYAPPPMRLVVAGRGSPPLSLARLRAAGRLTEIGETELRFTLEEASDFLGGTMGLDLSGEGIVALETGTEGWVAGLQLAAHALKGREDEARDPESFSGGTRLVFDYLAEEVLSRQPEDVREFMLRTSVVETLSAPLCEALTDTEDGGAMLEMLERDNLFLVPLDEEGRYYRYHHLFAAFLRERLRRTHPGAVSDLHRRAALWYERDRCITGAVEHALAAGDFEWAADLIEEENGARRRYVDASQLIRWAEALPDEMVRSRPLLCLPCAWALAHSGALKDAERRLEDTEAALGRDVGDPVDTLSGEERTMLGEVCIVRARMAAMREDAPLTTKLSNRALELLPEDEVRLRAGVALDLGHALCSTGDFNSASEAFAEAAATGRAAGSGEVPDNLRTALFAIHYQATLEIARGHLSKAETLLLDGKRLAEGRPDGVPSVAGIIDVGLGYLYYKRGDLDESRRLLEEGIERGRQAGEAKILVYGYINLSRIYMARGDTDTAHSLVLQAGRLTPRWPFIWARQARVWLAQGDVASAARWAREYRNSEDYRRYPRHLERIAIARVLLAEGRIDEAVDVLEELLVDVRSAGMKAYEMVLLTLLALASERRGDTGLALDHLRAALALAEVEGFVRVFIDEGPPMAALLRRLIQESRDDGDASNGGPEGYAGRMLERFVLESPRSINAAPPQVPGIEALSDREVEVLSLVAEGRSNAEIASELYLSVGTVKAHVHHIFGKLLVRNRSQAVARARELQLLD
jgi:LuxR family transcriptional regulator, maltose regulon positive regulatory protein